jgi:general secretion pathway protein D
MLEVTLVTLDTSDGCELGVELSKRDGVGKSGNVLVFGSFGLSTMDLKTGLPTIVPGAGFNGILVDPNTINAVVQAVATSSKAEVLSAPKVLVNDNATATLSSIAESPFTSINASQTVSTTSFAGYASAGTTITVTPHISEGDHLQLKYSVTLNSFTGAGGNGIPPPRQTNVLTSEVTVPDGYCIIVGGLNRKNDSDTANKIPLLGDIPVLKYFFGLYNKQAAQSTLFVFIRPIILRDDQFEDLKFLSERDLKMAKLAPNCPQSQPMTME